MAKTLFVFLMFWLFSAMTFFALKGSAFKHLTKALLFGLVTATIAALFLVAVVYLF